MQASIKKFDVKQEFYIDEGCYITEISNSDDDPSLSIARARVEPGITTKLHQLIETIERYVILEGEGLVEIGGLSSQSIKPNDVVIIPAGHSQKITNNGASDLVFLAICTPRFNQQCYEEIGSE